MPLSLTRFSSSLPQAKINETDTFGPGDDDEIQFDDIGDDDEDIDDVSANSGRAVWVGGAYSIWERLSLCMWKWRDSALPQSV